MFGNRDQLIQVIASMLAAAFHDTEVGQSVALEARAVDAPDPASERDPFFPPSPRDMGIDDAVQLEVRYAASGGDKEPLDELGLAIAREIVEHHGGTWSSTTRGDRRHIVALLPALVPIAEEETPSPISIH